MYIVKKFSYALGIKNGIEEDICVVETAENAEEIILTLAKNECEKEIKLWRAHGRASFPKIIPEFDGEYCEECMSALVDLNYRDEFVRFYAKHCPKWGK